ncbi:acetyl-CoA carboxylase carboxyltransferase subunit beta [Mycobacterium xenopi]|uniref:Acetyl-CoA carboxylase carboxyltransferase subunit beta n=1 Tax=Mycobacterium xenopi TaxID=1789 RepID=A0AAD1M0G8_MYCXE|nr:acetyl-CoA carboxylase carboxyltransferase subunit beta [Mycobacterium xenopi]
MRRTGIDELREAVLDDGSFVSWDTTPPAVPASESYARELAAARAATGVDEAVLTGEGRVFGRRVAVVVCEFGFLGGSIGVAAAERITAAMQRATAERLPLLASPSSGGTRMQEGTVAFLQMVKIAAAVTLHKRAHLPYLVYLRHPTTGGVFASWGSLGHITIAEPGALIGFLGPRVYEQLYGEPFPAGIQVAENLQRHGVIDGVVPLEELRDTLDRALKVLADAPEPPPPSPPAEPIPDVPAWDSVVASRRPDRPGVRHLLRHGCTEQVLLSGLQFGADQGEAATTLLALARFAGQPAVVLGQQRIVGGIVGPAALREARRGMALAAELRLPLVLVIDTAGPALSAEAEQGGLAGEIARCLADLVTLDTPTVSVLLGQGSGGRHWRWCPPTGCWPHCTAGWRRCRRRVPARSSSAIPHTPRNWLRHKGSGRPTCSRRASSIGSSSSTPMPPTSRSNSPNGLPAPSPPKCMRCALCPTPSA